MVQINLSKNSDLNTILDAIDLAFNIIVRRDKVSSTSPNGNDRFVSILNGNQIISAYFHPTKRHYATAEGKTKPGRSYAEAGTWAAAYAIRSTTGGNKAYYGTD